MTALRLLLCALLAALSVAPAQAHVPGVADGGAWLANALVVVPLFGVAALYAAGITRLWRRAGVGRGVPVWRVLACTLGLVALVVALLSPLDEAAEASFALHMTQHMLLMVVAAPLLALGSTGVALLAGLPGGLRMPLGRAFASGTLGRLRAVVVGMPAATAVHGVTVWIWHAPGLYEAALADPLVHWLEHLTMLGTAVVFWWAAVNAGRSQPLGHGAGVAALFLTMIHTGLLGILILLAPAPLYSSYAAMMPLGLTPLEDQQVAGMVMLLPGGIAYLAGGLALLGALLAGIERRQAVAAHHRRP